MELCRGLIFSGVLWAQVFPNLNNHVAEIRVTGMSQSDDRLKVTVENVSSRTIRGLSIVLGRHKIDADWSGLPSGGLAPNAIASVTISTAGIHSGGTRHHGTTTATLEVLGEAFTDGEPMKRPISALPSVAAAPAAKPAASVAVALPAKGAVPTVEANEPLAKAESAPLPDQRLKKPDTAILVPQRALPISEPVVAVTEHPTSPAEIPPAEQVKTPPGAHEQGSKDELAKLISLVEVYEPELASAFPRQALRQMVAAVVKEQNALAAQPDVTAFDHSQRSALQTFAYGIQLNKDRPDLDDDTLRVQVARFLRNQRQSLAKR